MLVRSTPKIPIQSTRPGPQSLEVLCIIMAFYLACPGKVFLNRGNHEDRHTCASYGFEREVGRKCTKAIFETINSVFMVLPICTIVDNKVMVVHGGIQDEHVTLQELSECNRRIFKGVPISAKMEASMTKTEFRLATVMLGALWSDPEPQVKHGVRPSPRGAGSAFSEQAAKAFLRSNSLSMIIRSHEVSRILPTAIQGHHAHAFAPASNPSATSPSRHPLSSCTIGLQDRLRDTLPA